MTTAEYNALSVREKDALVAEHVMGWKINRSDSRHWHTVGPDNPHRQIGNDCCADKYLHGAFMPHKCIAAAWEVVEELRERRESQFMLNVGNSYSYWIAYFEGAAGHASGSDATAPEAICLAALRAKGVIRD